MAADSVPADLGARLNAARIRQKIGVSELAEKCEVSREHASDLLAGRRRPTAVIARRLLEVLELDDRTADLVIEYADGAYVSSAGFGTVAGDWGDRPDRS